MSLIEVKNVSFSYDKSVKAVNNLSLSVNAGEFISVIGHNGSGKSTLAKLLNGLLKPTEGSVVVDGLDSAKKQNLFEIRKRVGVVFQNPDNQLVASIVEDDVAFGAENLGLKREEIKERIEFALEAVDMLGYRKSTPSAMSGGQKQRIAIAGVLALKPQVLVLDESTAMLDPRGRQEVMSVVEKLNKEQKTTVISITHYMEEVVNSDRVFVMNNGEIVKEGTPKEIFADREFLEDVGLELPPARRIANALKGAGLNVSDKILTERDLGDELCKL